ncbi:MAG: carboxypeptidase regulatory-like domain-containing protein [Desulfomonile tiedjei]|nr:carboxypeptidase regulatory-like domain-containing protein [Desulfomonile tiedjei]
MSPAWSVWRSGLNLQRALIGGAFFIVWAFCASELLAAPPGISGDSRMGLLYALTHLHPAAYLILFLIVVLAVVNLVFQGHLSSATWPFSSLPPLFGSGYRSSSAASRTNRRRPRDPMAPARGNTPGAPVPVVSRELLDDGVLSVRRKSAEREHPSPSSTPTPLEGMNHPLPDFASRIRPSGSSQKVAETKAPKEVVPPDFKFSSAVDLPSREEMERRQKEQLVVSGTVVGSDGAGIADVLVFLSDNEGNRVGQSCRSSKETGEFKVLANEPGQYVLSGYKRGLIMESSDPLLLPNESGRLEGYSFCMIPEGCVIQGKVVIADSETMPGGLEVRCSCTGKNFSRAAVTDSVAGFRITGMPMTSECVVEVRNKDGVLLGASETFDTARKREIHMNVTVGPRGDSSETASEDPEPRQPSNKTTPQPASQIQ